MSKLVQIPEDTLAALLREAGRPETVEAFLASRGTQAAIAQGGRLIRRARAAYWSRFWLGFSAALSWWGFFGGWDLEDFIAAVLLTGMTAVEFKVYHFFLASDARGALYGWWNQCLFAVLFVIYGAYHSLHPTIPPGISEFVDADMAPLFIQMEQSSYAIIGVVGAIGQFALACYYRGAREPSGGAV